MAIRTSTHAAARAHSASPVSSPVARLYRAASTSNRTLWATQGLLAIAFLFAGISKLVMSGETLTENSPFSVEFFRFIGVCETLGAIGLVLPGALGIRRELTPLAAIGLAIIMVGAVTVTVIDMGVAPAIMPLVVGMACAFIVAARSGDFRGAARQRGTRVLAN